LESEILPFYLEKLDSLALQNNGHFALGKLTWADFYFAAVLDYLNYMAKKNLIDGYSNLQKVVDNVLALDSIKAWIAKRPQTDL
jgi:prostaglandin-H2 D-isomerase / glutathione transferase